MCGSPDLRSGGCSTCFKVTTAKASSQVWLPMSVEAWGLRGPFALGPSAWVDPIPAALTPLPTELLRSANAAPATSASAAPPRLLPGASPRPPVLSCFLSALSPWRPVGRILTSFHRYQPASCKVQ